MIPHTWANYPTTPVPHYLPHISSTHTLIDAKSWFALAINSKRSLPVFVFLVLTLLPIDLVTVLCLPRLGFCTLDSDFLPPALIFACPATLSLPSLLQNCLPVFWPCLLVYSIKLLMDPTLSDVLLQKTSPLCDPAAIMQLSTELSTRHAPASTQPTYHTNWGAR